MPVLTIELPPQREQTAFNLKRWDELLDDPVLAKIEGRIETDRHGQIIMSPPPSASHGRFEHQIARLVQDLMQTGEGITECPISTADGVRAADAVWASDESLRNLGNRVVFTRAPEICVEVLSPRNTEGEIEEKKALYFDAGAKEVWICSMSGEMSFFGPKKRLAQSGLCPDFPKKVNLRRV
ncbi:MAG TPA: Uma2 family endonuclease [Verrucomicrobiae bacterium]|jgi:Uma2 family endonuclease|nr:Uma2 family endonuclease [Verrucomicrobiae bacterium]